MYSPHLYGSDSRYNSGSYYRDLRNNWCLEENIQNKPLSLRHLHGYQFCEDPIIISQVIVTVRFKKLRTVHILLNPGMITLSEIDFSSHSNCDYITVRKGPIS
ncbi:hypothetical protein AVEN_158636-1 [Araneus ventricosus]|uniref:Uncharacterized protein n=1 Tax=Araneus ventricosus TaxID=182803 RepID=A0A4Y2MY49_ARAVE|nr:hypothetical protein AVEN_158636-1 [Araneus ventricosus]